MRRSLTMSNLVLVCGVVCDFEAKGFRGILPATASFLPSATYVYAQCRAQWEEDAPAFAAVSVLIPWSGDEAALRRLLWRFPEEPM